MVKWIIGVKDSPLGTLSIPQLQYVQLENGASVKPKLNETEIAFLYLVKMIIAGSCALVCKQMHRDW